MSTPEDEVRLRHMLDAAHEAVSLARGKSRPDLDSERLLNLGLVRLLEIVGEAAARLSDAGRARYPGVPWASVVGMRNRLIHGYDAVDLDIVWEIIAVDLPRLIREAEGAPDSP